MKAATLVVAIVTQANGYVHESIPPATEAVRELARPAKTVVVRDAGKLKVRGKDAIVFLSTTGTLDLDVPKLRRFVSRGGAIVGLHAATNAFYGHPLEPAWEHLIGGIFKEHPEVGPRRVRVTDRGHPATKGLPRTFTQDDEFYEFRSPPGNRAHVLVVRDAPGYHPLVWCRRQGRGRVFYSALGHGTANWSETLHRRLVRGGLRWALGLRRGGTCRRDSVR